MRRPIRILLHALTACLLTCGFLVVAECVLLAREAAARRQGLSSLDDAGVVLPSASMHHSLRPGATIDRTDSEGGLNRVVINSFGLRGSEPAVPAPAGGYRVVFLGDETIFAAELDEAETAARQLEVLLQRTTGRRVEVINAGVPGYCPLLALLQFRHSLLGLNPDLIVLHYDANDVEDDRHYRRRLRTGGEGESLTCSHAGLIDRVSTGTSVTDFAVGRWAIRRLAGADECGHTGHTDWASAGSVAGWQTHVKHSLGPVVELDRLARSLSIRFVLTTTPGGERSGWARQGTVLRGFAAEQGVEFCDASGAFLNSAPELLLRGGGGLTRRGHYALAVELASHITGQRPSEPTEGVTVQQVSGRREVRISARPARRLTVVESAGTNNITQ